MIPIDDSNTLNIKLFPTYPPPPFLLPHHVPLSAVRLESLTDDNWDLTVMLILPFIDGVHSVRQIALLADADYKLVRTAVAHLLYYGCVTLLDVFSFGASYAITAEIGSLVRDPKLQEEGIRYVLQQDSIVAEPSGYGMNGTKLVELYCSFKQGQSLKNWCIEHAEIMEQIDIRRFITFGTIKNFLYRVHKYAIHTLTKASGSITEAWTGGQEFMRFLDGTHCFDEMCTQLMISEKELLRRLKEVGDVQIIQK